MWIYSRADFEPDVSIKRATSQWRETCALAGSIAESLMLSAATYVEAVWHSRAIAAGTEPDGMAIAQRYLADHAVESAVSVGHRLINFVVRVARTVPTTRDQLGEIDRFKSLGPSYAPFETNDHDAWLPLSEKMINALGNAIPSRHQASLDALDDLLHSPPWKSAFTIRAENFHRWRKEHESVIGVDQNSGPGRDVYNDDGSHIGSAITAHSTPHTISDGLTERTTEVAGDAVRTIGNAVEAVLNDTLNALPHITPTSYTFEIAHDGKSRNIWPIGRPGTSE
ncbi:hypothetical protein [Mycolicibacter sinensis]|uniref:hypothetical protein n=1 Tax=Mycolicibacter sinensis (strain JDM601) TaxID=875328 RepID=UPI0007EB35BB|nr:hypothetical protein [Mycolicibacter sinensis]OBH17311.1 hypothetical protein A5694_04260 [Mycolicibacter sinensis]